MAYHSTHAQCWYNHAEYSQEEWHWKEVYLISFPIMAEGTLVDPIVIEDSVVSSPVKIAMIGNDIRYTSLQCYSAWLYQH